MNITEEFLQDMQESQVIAKTACFLEFFTETPDLFLVKTSLPLDKVYEYCDQWLSAHLVSTYFANQMHTGDRNNDYAGRYDNKYLPTSSHHNEVPVLTGLAEYVYYFSAEAQRQFDECFAKGVQQLEKRLRTRLKARWQSKGEYCTRNTTLIND
jgi:hypothetical protein